MENWKTIVENELNKHGWELAEPRAEFLERVAQSVSANGDPRTASELTLQRATVRCYCETLFEAGGAQRSAAQQRAFKELWDYLLPRALYRLHDGQMARDATQHALIKIWEKLATCSAPAGFLGWCDQILLNVVRDEFRARFEKRVTERGIEYVERNQDTYQMNGELTRDEASPPQPERKEPASDLLSDALRGPMRDALVAALHTCLENERLVQVVLDVFLEDKNYAEIARQMDTSPLNVQVMKSRALKKLRECSVLAQLYEDWSA